ncbi:hypothetical protein D047_1610B, partial [Vibrio parahaemolyticus VPTS-2010_2]
DTS